jgi:hypothetical protein
MQGLDMKIQATAQPVVRRARGLAVFSGFMAWPNWDSRSRGIS